MTFLQPYFVLLASCSLIGALFILMAQLMKQRRRGWHDIVAELQRLNTEELSAVAIDFLTPHQGQIDLEPGAIWSLAVTGAEKDARERRGHAGAGCLRAAVEFYRGGDCYRTYENGCGSVAPRSAPRGSSGLFPPACCTFPGDSSFIVQEVSPRRAASPRLPPPARRRRGDDAARRRRAAPRAKPSSASAAARHSPDHAKFAWSADDLGLGAVRDPRPRPRRPARTSTTAS